MEEFTQITLDQWVQWKEDIRRKLQETAGNFVYIGYRLKQIRDSGMYDGCDNVFEWAEKEYGLNKSTVSRFIAVNEKYSEGGNSLELKAEYRGFSQSQLTEMLTLPDAECELITEQTTVKEIRELKNFVKEEEKFMNEPEPAETDADPEGRCQEAMEEPSEDRQKAAEENNPDWTPLQKCIIDFFKDRKELLKEVDEAATIKEAAELISPSGNTAHKKGTVFLFMYDYDRGVAYKQMGHPEPVKMTWDEFYYEIDDIYALHEEGREKLWEEIYSPERKPAPTACQPAEPVDVWKEESVQKEPESVQKATENVTEPQKTSQIPEKPQETEEEPVATSQQTETVDPDIPEDQPVKVESSWSIQRMKVIVSRYDSMLGEVEQIKQKLGDRNWNEAKILAETLVEKLNRMMEEDPEELKEALDSVFDD